MVEYLKAENWILWDKLPARITINPQERKQLVRLDRPFGAKVQGFGYNR